LDIFGDVSKYLVPSRGLWIGWIKIEHPKLNLHIPAMQRKLAEVMHVKEEDVSVKAATSEKFGFTGHVAKKVVVRFIFHREANPFSMWPALLFFYRTAVIIFIIPVVSDKLLFTFAAAYGFYRMN
jgi:hypothetical protein